MASLGPNGKLRVKTDIDKAEQPMWKRASWLFEGRLSNITGAFADYEMGAEVRLKRAIRRETFVDEYTKVLASMFDMNEGQRNMLKLLITDKQYKGVFRYNPEQRVGMSEKLGISPSTVEAYFRAMTSAKKMIILVNRGYYRLNSDFLFNLNERKYSQFLSVSLTFVFEDTKNVEEEITEDEINRLIRLYRMQQKRKIRSGEEQEEEFNG